MKMDKTLIFVLMIVFMTGLFSITCMAIEDEEKNNKTIGTPACRNLNELMDWTDQVYLYRLCEEYGVEYYLALAVIEKESEFKARAWNRNTNDRGLMQINQQWIRKFIRMGYIEKADDLFDTKKNIRCGMYILAEAVKLYGNTERAYCYYNTGRKDISSNRNSRDVMKYWKKWEDSFRK